MTHPATNTQPVCMPGTETLRLRSHYVGAEFELMVARPTAGPESGDGPWPVLYVLDANGLFPIVRHLAQILHLPGLIPPALVVGIGYPVSGFAETHGPRTRDYTPSCDSVYMNQPWMRAAGLTECGGAEAFLAFIENEVSPMVASRWNGDTKDQALAGVSLGGLFCLFALLRAPEIFRRMICVSPGIFWDDAITLQYEKAYAASHSDLGVRLFLAAGGLEDQDNEHMARLIEDPSTAALCRAMKICQRTEDFARLLQSRAYPSLELQTVIFPDERHVSVAPAALSRGIRMIYGDC